jgi:hypothetical protein
MISHTDSTYISKLKNEYHEDVDQYCVLAGLKGLVDKEDVENPLYMRDIDHMGQEKQTDCQLTGYSLC